MGAVQASMGVYLGVLSIVDFKKKNIKGWLLAIGAVLVAAMIIWGGRVSLVDRMAGAGIGILMLIISFVTREAIGRADCILLIYLGISMGYFKCSQILLASLTLCCLVSMVRLGFHVITRKQRIAFIPYLLLGFLCCWR